MESMVMNMSFSMKEEAKALEKEIIDWRRELHKMPEIAYELPETSKFIRNKLEQLKIEYNVIGQTGVCGTLYGADRSVTIALRSDMDGLPIREATGLEFASQNEGSMHACGHDAHMAMLLGAATILAKHREELPVNVRLIFQPAEENVGGAQTMIAEGCLENPHVDMIFGLHVGNLSDEISCGQIGVRAGAMMASVDDFRMTIKGKGGHGAAPHQCVDPIAISGEIICALQRIISRELPPTNPAVVTIGKIVGGQAFNIIPDKVELEGCIRTLCDGDRDFIQKRFLEIVHGTCSANRAAAEIDYIRKYPVLVNDETAVQKLVKASIDIVGEKNTILLKNPVMASEDMAYYLNEIPGAFFYLGTNNEEKGIEKPNHHPGFNVDEDVLWIGTSILVQCVFGF